MLFNPCGEASLKPYQFCNLTTINMSNVKDQADFNKRAKSAAFIGTIQASYTQFHYLRDIWKTTTDKDALIGVSMTGLASEKNMSLNFEEAAKVVMEENERVAKLIGINKAARTTLLKPEGTTSTVLKCSSGIHAWHDQDYYIRRIRLNKDEPLYKYLASKIPDLLEDEIYKPKTISVLSVPIKVPEGAISRDESAIDLLNRCVKINKEWIKPGHRTGANTHNVSCTITVKNDEWEEVREFVWLNKDSINGMTFYRYDGNSYEQAPFESCSKEVYDRLSSNIKSIDLTEVIEDSDDTDHKGEAACAGNGCQLTSV
jgi:ribonucleoside-diphosphate reductase alpha chain